jgi:DNA-binding FadR family transcriptional regulator
VAATFLECENTTMTDLMNAANALMTEASRLAACNMTPSGAKRMRLIGAVQRLQKTPVDDLDRYSAADGEFVMAVLELATNPAISLFVRSLYNFGFAEASRRVFTGKPDRIEIRRQSRITLGDIILAGDAQRAVALSDDHYEIARHWMAEQMDGADHLVPSF